MLLTISGIDWAIIIVCFLFVSYMTVAASKYNKGVSDFLAANRCAGRYLLGVAEREAGMGAVSVIVQFEIIYASGFAKSYWGQIGLPLMLVLMFSGWVIYRYRRTRALTLSQFFEMRYSRKFRIFAGMIAWGAGIINFGIFPGVGARFFITFLHLPAQLTIHATTISTFPLVMGILIGVALFFTFIGGQISILVSDFWQGILAGVIFLVLVFFLWFSFSWSDISQAMLSASQPGVSLVDPFDISEARDFNFWFFVMVWILIFYQRNAWQGSQGYKAAAATAHEAKMAQIVGALRETMMDLGIILMPLIALTVMHHPKFADLARTCTEQLAGRFPGDATLQSQMRTPVVLSHILPKGLLGGLAAAMLGFFITTNDTYMHSWGSIFIQDVVMPFRKKPFAPKQHLRLLRWSIVGVAVFAFFFSWLFPLKEYIYMFFQITGAIFLGGAGAAIIGGLYWKRGTTSAAWGAMLTGAIFAVVGMGLQSLWEYIPALVAYREKFPLNGQVMGFIAAVLASLVYVSVSLLGKKSTVNLDKILHRGRYAVAEEQEQEQTAAHAAAKPVGWFWRLIGVNSREFSTVDRALFLFMFLYSMSYFVVVVVLAILHFAGLMNDGRWLSWWRIMLCINLVIATVSMVWFSIGGFVDLRKMFKRLSVSVRNVNDDGWVPREPSPPEKDSTR